MNPFSLLIIAFTIVIAEKDSTQEKLTTECKVQFSVLNAGLEVGGFFSRVDVEIKFDPTNLNESFIHATADPASIQTGIVTRDKHLMRSDYFDVKNYPAATIYSKNFQKKGKNKFSCQCELTIKNLTRTINMPITLLREGNVMIYRSQFKINRLDFMLGEESMILENNVTVNLEARQVIHQP